MRWKKKNSIVEEQDDNGEPWEPKGDYPLKGREGQQ